MRLADIQLAFPFILLALAVIGVLGPASGTSSPSWASPAGWYTRGSCGGKSSRSGSASSSWRPRGRWAARRRAIIVRHLVPNALTPWLVIATLDMARVIIVESALSFLGLGIPPPTPTWGGMLADGRVYMSAAWWLATFPGLAILVTVLGINLLGDGLRDTLDPRLKV